MDFDEDLGDPGEYLDQHKKKKKKTQKKTKKEKKDDFDFDKHDFDFDEDDLGDPSEERMDTNVNYGFDPSDLVSIPREKGEHPISSALISLLSMCTFIFLIIIGIMFLFINDFIINNFKDSYEIRMGMIISLGGILICLILVSLIFMIEGKIRKKNQKWSILLALCVLVIVSMVIMAIFG